MEKSGDGFIDRSKVRILLCDNDEKSCQEVLSLLCKCSYQVTSVRSPRQVIDALNAEGADIDIILSEVNLPMSKGLKMLKYIMRDKELRRIPVIMMSARDEVSVVVKFLKFGAADYLVKPLRTNELLNLWTHMWRRRRMLGLAEKDIVNYEVDLVVSDPSDTNTNSTTLFSDDSTNEKSRKATDPDPDPCTLKHKKHENNAFTAADPHIEIDIGAPSGYLADDFPARADSRTGRVSPYPKKSKLKTGESSAFIMYVKSNTPRSNNPVSTSLHEPTVEPLKFVENLTIASNQVGTMIPREGYTEPSENHSPAYDYPRSNNFLDSFPPERNLKEHESPDNVPNFSSQTNYPYYMSGMTSQVRMQNPVNSNMLHHYNHFRQFPPAMAHYPYYPPFGICLQPGQIPVNTWQPFVGPSSNEGKLTKVDRREAALMRFRLKRKERCFEKKVRYVNRKKLVDRRLRVRGQFVRKANGVNVDLNGLPASAEEDEEDEEEYDEDDQSGTVDFSPDDDDAMFCPR